MYRSIESRALACCGLSRAILDEEDASRGIVDAIAMHSDTIGQALEKLCRYHHLWGHPFGRIELVFSESSVRLPAGLADRSLQSPWPVSDYLFARLLLRLRSITGLDIVPQAVRFRHCRQTDEDEYERVFRKRVHFASELDVLTFDKTMLPLPLPTANAPVREILEAHARSLLDARPVSMEVRRSLLCGLRGSTEWSLIRHSLRSPRMAESLDVPSMMTMAKRLGMSPRTLQRRLSEEGTSYHDILDAVRMELARFYVHETDLTLAEMALLLGYASEVSFHQACKRWFESPPGALRRARRQVV